MLLPRRLQLVNLNWGIRVGPMDIHSDVIFRVNARESYPSA